MKEKLNEVRDLVKGIKKVENEKKNELENSKKNYKKTVKYVAATIGISIVALFSIMSRNPKDFVPPASIPTYQEDEQHNDDNSKKEDPNTDDDKTTQENQDNGQNRKYSPSTTLKEEEKMSHGTTVEDTLHNENNNTNLDAKDSYKPEVEDTTKTDEALKKAEQENIPVMQGDVKDEKGETTGDKITVTQGHTTDTEVDLDYEEKDRTNNKKIDVGNSTNATRNEEPKTNVTKENVYSTQDDRLDELMNKTTKQIEDDDYQR